jgi:dTDP-glucose 4,6-dehydratase
MHSPVMNRTQILITGGAGFIGSHFVHYMLDHYPEYTIINLDKLTYAALAGIPAPEPSERYTFIKGDICNRELVEHLFAAHQIRHVIHFAAESHVDQSILHPDRFVVTNVLGTQVLLDVSWKYWSSQRQASDNDGMTHNRFHHISTDEVYGSLGETGYFTENSPYAPNSPYSASKASSDMMVRSYHKTYGMNTVITNCSNNYGPGQHSEKLIPTIIRKALSNEPIPIYGAGKNIRDWLHVLDHCRGIDRAFHRGRAGETYALGGNQELDNLTVATMICDILNDVAKLERDRPPRSYRELITFVTDRLGHDYRYAIYAGKANQELDWSPQIEFEQGLRETVMWYKERLRP